MHPIIILFTFKNYIMRHLLIILALLSFNISSVFAQGNASIRGKIVDEKGIAMPWANVVTSAYGKTIGATTNDDGYFVLKPLPEGKYNITISFIGYGNYTLKGIELTNNQTYFTETIKMSMDNMLTGGEVVAQRPIDPDQTITKMTVNAEFLQTIPRSGGINGILRSISSDIQISSDNKIILRGSRPGNTTTIIDNVKSLGEASVPSLAIASISVYSGGVPVRYGDFTGGVVLIQTKGFFDYYYANKNKK